MMSYPPKRYPVNLPTLLEQVNRIRTALMIGEGKLDKLPKGEPGEFRHCVLAVALSNGWQTGVSDGELHLSMRALRVSILKNLPSV